MAKDPAFLFYPGDYLRDTQCLSEKTQVAYDRIMCEHMRNICITQQQLKFFTKRLSEEEVEELMLLLTKVNGGYQIEWVAESINKRREYSDSRRKNREGKSSQKDEKISQSYDEHMEDEIEDEDEDINKGEKFFLEQFEIFRKLYPGSKKGLDTEFENLKKKHKDYIEIVPQLPEIIKRQMRIKKAKKDRGEFVPEWKNLQTWINGRCWEEEYPEENRVVSSQERFVS